MRINQDAVCKAPGPATLIHTGASLTDNHLPVELTHSHPPWYLCKSQVHETFFFSEFTFFIKPFPVSPDRKRWPQEFPSFRSYVTVPVSRWVVSPVVALQVGSVQGSEGEGGGQGREGSLVVGFQFSQVSRVPWNRVDSAILL